MKDFRILPFRGLHMAFEEDMANQEATDGKVEAKAISLAKEKMAQEDLERDAREVSRRLRDAEAREREAIKDGRYASKKKNILKDYSEKLKEAKTAFEASGDWKAYDKKLEEISEEKSEKLGKAKVDVYGDECWRIRD